KVLLITLVASVFGMVGFNEVLLSEEQKSSNSSLTIENITVDDSITLLLPQVIVELKEGKPKYGWLSKFNSAKKEIQITLNGSSQMINFKDIKMLKFAIGKAPFSSPDILVRNEKELSEAKQENWVVPTKDFQLRNDRIDQAKLKLTNSILANSQQLILGSSYVIETIEFDESLNNMRLKVFLYI
ncbi:MAG: hypothetical protein WBA39_26270, partial [Rivularia sp. (in: cyanobacteria)]